MATQMTKETPENANAESALLPKSRWLSGWALRGYLSTLGQGLQMVSSIKTTSGSPSDRQAIFGFTFVNLLANAINILFGAQHKDDPNHLRYLKQEVNNTLEPWVHDAAALPEVDQQLTANAKDNSLTGYLRRHSVTISEFVLRTTGSLSLIAPITGWGRALRSLRNGMPVAEVFQAARNKNAVTFGAGWFSLAGKGFILAAKEPDPYSAEPPSLWQRARERVMFRASSVSEAIGAAWMAHDRFTTQKVRIGNELKPDYFGGYGNVSVLAGYVPRWIAPYGTREVNMPELYAHIAKGLQALSEEKRPSKQLEIAEAMAQHFAASQLTAATISHEIDKRMGSVSVEKPTVQIRVGEEAHAQGRIDVSAPQRQK